MADFLIMWFLSGSFFEQDLYCEKRVFWQRGFWCSGFKENLIERCVIVELHITSEESYNVDFTFR